MVISPRTVAPVCYPHSSANLLFIGASCHMDTKYYFVLLSLWDWFQEGLKSCCIESERKSFYTSLNCVHQRPLASRSSFCICSTLSGLHPMIFHHFVTTAWNLVFYGVVFPSRNGLCCFGLNKTSITLGGILVPCQQLIIPNVSTFCLGRTPIELGYIEPPRRLITASGRQPFQKGLAEGSNDHTLLEASASHVEPKPKQLTLSGTSWTTPGSVFFN